MTHAAPASPHAGNTEDPVQRARPFGLWSGLLAAFIGLTALLALLSLLPDGPADAVQTVVGWLVVGVVAAIALLAIVEGLERLLDSEAG
jgi:hypothetical protein